jgi:hypothetical protein
MKELEDFMNEKK